MELEKLILSEDEVLEFVDTKARQDITNTNTNLNKKVDDYTKAVSSDFTTLRSETDNTIRYLTSIITNHQDVTDEELGRIREELLDSIPKNLSDLVDDKGFLTHLPDELITEIELALALDNKGFVKLGEVIDKINILRQELKNYSDEKTQQHITDTDTKLATLNEVLLQYIHTKNSDLTSYVDNLVSSSIKEIIPEELIDAKIEAASTGHASENYVDSKVREATADKATITYVDNRVQSYVEDKVTIADVNKKVNDAVANKATTSYVDTAVANAIKDKATEIFATNYTDTKVADKATVTYVNSTVANAVSDKASVTYVDTKVAKLVGTTPETLDTLEEIANAIKTSDSILNTLNSAIGTKADKTTVDNILKSLPMKADQSYVEGLSNTLSAKADKAELTSLSSIINNKADKSDLDTLREELNNQISEEVIEELTAALELKANKTDIPTTVASLADANEYVKFTDYSTNSSAGIVRTGAGLQINADGIQRTHPAIETTINAKSDSYRPITSKYLDYAIKTGLTTNTIELTDDEKTSAANFIGCVKTAPSDVSWLAGKTIAYCANYDGNGNPTNASTMQVGRRLDDGIARYNSKRLFSATPVEDDSCANKAYVDNADATKVSQVEYSQYQTFADGSDGGVIGRLYMRFRDNTENSIVAHCQGIKYTVPVRDANGNFYVSDPVQPTHVTTKRYVDNAIANIKPFTVEELEDGSYSITLMGV